MIRSRRRRASARRRDLDNITRDGVAHSGMVGLGESYTIAFALALGHGEVAAGLLATAPLLTGAALQLLTPVGVVRMRSHRRWMVSAAVLQAATLVVLLAAAVVGEVALATLFAVMALYWAAAFSAGSAWNAWMADLVPARIRATYFARRSRLAQITLALSLAGGGATLHVLTERGSELGGFALLFGLAALSRLASASFLARQRDVVPHPESGDVGIRSLLVRLQGGTAGRLFLYLIAVQLSVHIAAPYFTPYMLCELELSYLGFVTLTAASFVSRVAVAPWLGNIGRRFGARRLLVLGGLGVVPLPALWLVSDRFEYLLVIQLLAGASWSAYELAVLLLIIETLDGRERLALLAALNVANSLAMVAGALVGAWLLGRLSAEAAGYAIVFGLSFGARLLTLLLLRRIPEIIVRQDPVPTRTIAIRPSLGAIQPPVVAAVPIVRSDSGLERDDARVE